MTEQGSKGRAGPPGPAQGKASKAPGARGPKGQQAQKAAGASPGGQPEGAPAVRLAVRELVEFILRCGSIDSGSPGGMDRALEGGRIHRRLQKQEGARYQAEVPLSLEVEQDGVRYVVEGRADGLFCGPDGVAGVDEIKTTTAPAQDIGEDFSRVHWGQAMCYAHILCAQRQYPRMDVRLTYYQVDTGEIKRFIRRHEAGELAAFFAGLLGQYGRWARFEAAWRREREAAAKSLRFPFAAYREGQRRLAAAVYRTIAAGGRLFAQAPTGIGKTMSTLFPAVKALGEGKCGKIFYLTAKTLTRQAAEEALCRLRAAGASLRSVTLTAKDKICPLPQRACTPRQCPYADGYFDRVNEAVYALLQEGPAHLSRQWLEEAARRHTLCPYELSLDMARWCDVVIGDFNYLFDPVAYLRRFFSEGSDAALLIDEAHNLVDRGREMYSAQLQKSAFLLFKKELKGHAPLTRAAQGVNAAFLALRRAIQENTAGEGPPAQLGGASAGRAWMVLEKPPEGLAAAVDRFVARCDEWLAGHRESPLHTQVLPLYFEAVFFQRVLEEYGPRYAALAVAEGREVLLRLLCLDAAPPLDACMKRGRAAVLFSATLSPMEYFMAVLGGGEGAKRCALASPFPPGHLCLLVADTVSTRYAERERSLGAVADLLYQMARGKAGNYLCFFPSYAYLRAVHGEFCRRYPQVPTLAQRAHMDEGEREDFLRPFSAPGAGALLGFCVLGGIYSEGIDLAGERLLGAAVVGVGLPQVNPEQELLRGYYEQKQGVGFDYAYRYPGMNKVLQAAGRVIRSDGDRGVVLLIDSRFSAPAYRALFPAHWQGAKRVRTPQALAERLQEFWGGAREEAGRAGQPAVEDGG